MRKSYKLGVLLIAVIMLFLSACGQKAQPNASSNSPAPASQKPAESAPETKPEGKAATKVVWWHSMGGELGKAVDKLVSDFNASRSDIQVEAIYQGTYDESLNKMKASMDAKTGPTMIQVYEIGSRFMIDSKAITPMQTFIDRDKFDISGLEENILSYYTFDGQLYSMPFNTSNPIMYYNKTLFKNAGLDPENPPKTYEEVAQAAKTLSKDGVTGASFALYGWFMEQFFANQGAEYVNNGNGRTSSATESLANSEAGVQTLSWLKDMVDQKIAVNLGRKTDDTKKAFAAGQIAMTLDSTASLRGIVDAVGDKFEVGTAYLPKPQNAKEGGVIVGGASLYMLNNRPEEEQLAAWEFIKFLAMPEQQAYWHTQTGYFPITKKAYDQPIVKENLEKFPQFETAVNQLHATKINKATQGAVMGVFPEARQIMENAMEEAMTGQKSPKDALDTAAAEITKKIEVYNKTVAK